MRTLFLILFTFSTVCHSREYLDPVMKKAAEALINTDVAKKSAKSGERFFYHHAKNDFDLNRKDLANFGALGYAAVTGVIDSEKLVKIRVRTNGIDFYPKVQYYLRETAGKIEFSVTIPIP